MDKFAHFIAGFLISTIAVFWTLAYTPNKEVASIVGFTAGTVAGISKEVYDYYTGGTVENFDLLSATTGASIMPILIHFIDTDQYFDY